MVTLIPTGPIAGVKLVIVGGLITVKLPALVAVPPGVVTLIVPVVAPVGTVARIEVAELTVKVALAPLKATRVVPLKLVPLMVTLVPTGPLAGVKLVIVGGLITVKLPALVAVPPGVVTLIVPVVALVGTVARMDVAELTVKVALTPLKATPLVPVKLVPLMVTLVPTGPLAGVKPVIAGGLITVKLPALLAVPPGVVTLMVTLVPTGPLAGVKPVIVGGLITVKLPALVAVPPGVVTLIVPVVAPAGTVAWIEVAELTVKVALTLLNATAVVPVKLVP